MNINIYIKKSIEIMKKLIGFLAIVVITLGCTCLGQVPTQTVYATDASCTVALLDYTQIVPVSDNCEVATYTQSPVAGTILDATNPVVNVHLQVIDVTGNESNSNFDVVLLDTISPQFHFPDSMLAYQTEDVSNMYWVFESWVQENIMDWMAHANWDTLNLLYGIDTITLIQNTIEVEDEMFAAYLRRQ